MQRVAFMAATVAFVGFFAGGFALVARDFGLGSAAILLLVLAWPLIVAVRLSRRWSAVRDKELAFLAILFCIAGGASTFLVGTWYDSGLHRRHAEDLSWAEFEVRLRDVPAFRDVRVHKSEGKHIHWVGGVLDSDADLEHLNVLASECGIIGRHRDDRFVPSDSLTVRERRGS